MIQNRYPTSTITMTVIQVQYARPYPLLVTFVFTIIQLPIIYVFFRIKPPLIVWFSFNAFQLANLLLDPELCCLRFKRTNADGKAVKIRKPILGFIKCETVIMEQKKESDVELIHERAFIRL